MSGHVGDLTPEQEQALRKLKVAVADIPNKPEDDDYFYLRWLRARKFDVGKAELMIRNHMVFRSEMGVDSILETWIPPEVLVKCGPTGFFGEDIDGNPVVYDNHGNVDSRGFIRACSRENIIKFLVYRLEKIMKLLKEFTLRKGRHIGTATFIMDVENLSVQKHYYWPAIRISREGLRLMEANYPEIIKQMIVVKAPSIFPLAYNFLKPFIDKQTREKLVVLSSNWKEELQEYISPDQLPQAYGGTRCEPDPWCTNYINPGCDVPPEYYLTNQTEIDKQEMDRVVVRRGGNCELEYEVDVEESVLKWEFVSTSHDVSYCWFFRHTSVDKKPKDKEVVPLKRASSHIIPETGSLVCTSSGTYILKFDNSYSWTRSKEVFYYVQVLPPNTGPCLPDLPLVEPHLPNLTIVDPHLAVATSDLPSSDVNGDDEFFDCKDNVN